MVNSLTAKQSSNCEPACLKPTCQDVFDKYYTPNVDNKHLLLCYVIFVQVCKSVLKSRFVTLSSNDFEGSKTTYAPQSPTFTSANVAQLVTREADNPKVLGSILNFDRFLGSIPTFDHFFPKEKSGKALQGNAFL